MRQRLWAGIVVVVGCFASNADAASVLVNGSFEEGPPPFPFLDVDIAPGSTVITGWTVTGGGVDLGEDPWDVADGARLVDLDGRNALFGGIEQIFATEVGQAYRVSFDLSGNPGDAPNNGLPLVKHVRVSVGGTSRDYFHDSSGQSIESLIWQSLAFSFSATDTLTTLSFVSQTPFPNSYGPLIDNVAVNPVPEPGTLFLLAIGGTAATQRTRREMMRRIREWSV